MQCMVGHTPKEGDGATGRPLGEEFKIYDYFWTAFPSSPVAPLLTLLPAWRDSQNGREHDVTSLGHTRHPHRRVSNFFPLGIVLYHYKELMTLCATIHSR
jgi:hypothetical protein